MRRMHWYYILLVFAASALHIRAWEFAANSPFAQPEIVHHQDKGKIVGNEIKAVKGMSWVGSRPPNCEHKCRGCRPCIAVQVPKNADHFRIQYANYEPEGWVCNCGSSFFVP